MKGGIFISQFKYVKEVLKTFGMEDCKPVGTPMVISCRLLKEDDSPSVDEKEYKSMIEKLHYVVHSRPDIAHVVGFVARFQKSPKETHMTTVKRIFKYLRGIVDYGLWYTYLGNFSLQVFTDADWARNLDDRKRTTSGAFFLRGRLVSWTSKKQTCISQSTT